MCTSLLLNLVDLWFMMNLVMVLQDTGSAEAD